MQELRNETLWKLCEAEAMLRSQVKTAKAEPGKVLKKVMDPEQMQVRAITIEEMVAKNTEAVTSLRNLLETMDEMLEEEASAQA